jgi:hypothetical protein
MIGDMISLVVFFAGLAICILWTYYKPKAKNDH